MTLQQYCRPALPAALLVLIAVWLPTSGCQKGPTGSDGTEYQTAPAALTAVDEAERALASGNLYLAQERSEDAMTLDPESPHVLLTRGYVLTQMDRLEEARFALEKLVETYPRFDDAWFKLGNVAIRQQLYAEAATYYENQIAINATPAAWYNLALARAEQDDAEGARDALQKAMKLDPSYPNAYAAMADLAEKDGNFQEALEYARQAAEKSPNDSRLKEKVGFMLLRLGRNDEALAVLEGIVEREPWDYQARYNYGQALQRLGRASEAEEQLRRAEQDRENQGVLRRLERSIRMDPTNGRMHFALAIEYQKWSRLTEALREYGIAKSLMPDNLLVDLNMATIYLHQNDLVEARRRFQEIIDKDASIAPAWLNLGFLEARDGDMDKAEEAWARAIALDPSYSSAVDTFRARHVASR